MLTPMSTKITIEAEVPDEWLEDFLHMVRLFDHAHSGCHFAITSISESDMSMAEIVALLERLGLKILYAGKRQ